MQECRGRPRNCGKVAARQRRFETVESSTIALLRPVEETKPYTPCPDNAMATRHTLQANGLGRNPLDLSRQHVNQVWWDRLPSTNLAACGCLQS